jgi:hypothetical protein
MFRSMANLLQHKSMNNGETWKSLYYDNFGPNKQNWSLHSFTPNNQSYSLYNMNVA